MRTIWNPTRPTSLRGAICAGLMAALAASACGGDEANGGDDTPLFDVAETFPDVPPEDTSTPDTTQPPQDVAEETTPPIDTRPPELIPDTTPPFIVSSTPADGASNVALPLVITLEFDEPLVVATVTNATVKLVGFNNEDIPATVTVAADEKTVTLRPVTNNQSLASPYRVRVLGGIPAISDKAGNRIVNDIFVHFTTANYPNQDRYRDVAIAHAPTIVSAVQDKQLPQSQVPTRFDADGDWDFTNNRSWIRTQANSVIPAVYYAVTETYTHYFVLYQYFFPDVNHSVAVRQHANGSSGVLITVEKATDEQPERAVAANVYWASGTFAGANNEENFTYVTSASGLGAAANVTATQAEGTLFPDGHFESFIAARSHEHCNRNDSRPSGPCSGVYAGYTGDALVFKYTNGSPTPFQKVGSAFPSDMSEVPGELDALGYALIPLGTTLWPRRFQSANDQIFQSNLFTFDGRSADFGDGIALTTRFIDTVGSDDNAAGKPVWSWRWNPTSGPGAGFFRNTGAFALDPAWYFMKRHNPNESGTNPVQPWDATEKTGFATNYCFNAFLNIDLRGVDPDCPGE